MVCDDIAVDFITDDKSIILLADLHLVSSSFVHTLAYC